MVHRKNFTALCDAVDAITIKLDKSMKDSLMVGIQYLLKNKGSLMMFLISREFSLARKAFNSAEARLFLIKQFSRRRGGYQICISNKIKIY